MKKLKYLIIVGVMIIFANTAFSQTGELDRFSNESLNTKNKIRIFPNPSVDILQVKITNADFKKVNLTVHNIIGNVMDVQVRKLSNEHYSIKVEDLAPGYYLLSIRDDQAHLKEVYKFLKR